jgi:hypothetical protein
MGLIPKEAIEAVNDNNGSSLFIDLKPGDQKFRVLSLRFYFETRTPSHSPIRSKTKLTKIPFNGRFELSRYGRCLFGLMPIKTLRF